MKRIKVLLADDHALMRMGLKTLIESQDDMTVVGEAANGELAAAAVAKLRPDVVIMDLMMPVVGGAEATERIRASHPEAKVVVLTSFGASDELQRAIRAGAVGAQLKESPSDFIPEAIRAVMRGETAIAEEVRDYIDAEPIAAPLTEKQQSVLAGLSRGLTNREIAEMHGITASGVKRHLRSIFAKLGAGSRSEAVSIAHRRQLIRSE